MHQKSIHFISMVALCLMPAIGVVGCHKSAQEIAEQKALERHQREVKQMHAERAEFDAMMKTPGGRATLGAVRALIEMHNRGRLPADKDGIRLDYDQKNTSADYPIRRDFTLGLRDKNFKMHYTLVKSSSNSAWKLQKAWRTNGQGTTVEEYPVP